MSADTGPRVTLPGHQLVKRGKRLIEVPFALVTPRDGRLPRCISVLPDGTSVAWDMCAGCGRQIVACTHDVPIEPGYIERMRTGTTAAFSYSTPGTAVSRSERSGADHKISGQGVPAGIAISDLVTADVVAGVKAATEARREEGN